MVPYPVELRAKVVAMLAAGASVRATARAHGVQPSTVRAYRDRYRQTGSLEPTPPPPRRTRIADGDERLRHQMAAYPAASMREHRWRWEQATGERIGKDAMASALRRHGYVQASPAARHHSTPHTERPRPALPPRSPAMRQPYPTDLTDAEWTMLEPLIPPAKTGGRPPRDRREIIDAITYVLRSGCAWRLLPHDFPPWQTVYHYYRCWRIDGTWQQIHDQLREQVREQAGRAREPSAGSIDSQSVRTTEKGGSGATTGARR